MDRITIGESVKAAIGGSSAEYAAFKEWAGSVKGAGSTGASAAGEAAVVANTNAAAAQHGKLARHLAADGKFVDEVVGLVSVVDAESGDDGGEVVRHVDMRTAPGADDGAGEERPVPPSGEARADHDERRTAIDRTGLWAGSPLPDHQAGRVAKLLSEVQHWNRAEAVGQMKTPCL